MDLIAIDYLHLQVQWQLIGVDAHFLAHVADIRRADNSAAIHPAYEALRLAPTSATAHSWVASVVAADGNMRDALTHLQFAVRLQPYAPLRGKIPSF